MGFAYQLQASLRDRNSRVALEFAAGDSLETVLGRHLLAVEQSAETELLTSILLLDEAGKHILHGAAPSLPKSYCEAIHGLEIGPSAGSCGTAAYSGHAIYVTDIATDSLWDDYRHLALPHGLRACWSTPIRNPGGELIGTFAVYHLTPRSPTPDEVESIRLITDHVAQAIMFSRSSGIEIGRADLQPGHGQPGLKLVSDHNPAADDPPRNGAAGRFEAYASKLDRYAGMVASRKFAATLKAVAEDCRKLGDAARHRQKDSEGDS
jgi:hypothetical protein